MGSVTASDEENREFDSAEAIFVAVGKSAEQSEGALLWAVQNFTGKRICVLHVHRPSRLLAMSEFLFFLFLFSDAFVFVNSTSFRLVFVRFLRI